MRRLFGFMASLILLVTLMGGASLGTNSIYANLSTVGAYDLDLNTYDVAWCFSSGKTINRNQSGTLTYVSVFLSDNTVNDGGDITVTLALSNTSDTIKEPLGVGDYLDCVGTMPGSEAVDNAWVNSSLMAGTQCAMDASINYCLTFHQAGAGAGNTAYIMGYSTSQNLYTNGTFRTPKKAGQGGFSTIGKYDFNVYAWTGSSESAPVWNETPDSSYTFEWGNSSLYYKSWEVVSQGGVGIDAVLLNDTSYLNVSINGSLGDNNLLVTLYNITALDLGTYSVTINVTDADGSLLTNTSFIIQDTTPPVWTQTPPSDFVWTDNETTFKVNATDNYGFSGYLLTGSTFFVINASNGVISINGTSSINVQDTVYLWAVDVSGNNASAEVTMTYVTEPLAICSSGAVVFNITFLREYNSTPMNASLDIAIINMMPGNLNFSTSANSSESVKLCVYPAGNNYTAEDILMEFKTPGFETRHYFMENILISNQTPANIFLYLITEATGEPVTFTVKSQTGALQSDVIVRVQKYDIGTNSYRTVAMGKSDVNGIATSPLELYKWYRLSLHKDGVVLRVFGDTWLADDAYNLITEGEGGDTTLHHWESAETSCFYNNATLKLSCQIHDTSGIPLVSSLTAWQEKLATRTLLCNVTETSPSATLICDFSGHDLNSSSIYWRFNGTYSNPGAWIFDSGIITYGLSKGSWGTDGLVLSSVVFLTLTSIGFAIHPVMGFILMELSLFGAYAFGTLSINPVVLIGLGSIFGIVIGLIIRRLFS